jgi:hypothetical protein
MLELDLKDFIKTFGKFQLASIFLYNKFGLHKIIN